jgi:hypothetical protein
LDVETLIDDFRHAYTTHNANEEEDTPPWRISRYAMGALLLQLGRAKGLALVDGREDTTYLVLRPPDIDRRFRQLLECLTDAQRRECLKRRRLEAVVEWLYHTVQPRVSVTLFTLSIDELRAQVRATFEADGEGHHTLPLSYYQGRLDPELLPGDPFANATLLRILRDNLLIYT